MRRLHELGDSIVATCVIVRGELAFMVEKSDRREHNRRLLHSFLQDIRVYEVDSETADIYGRLKVAILDRYGPKEKAKRRRARVDKLGVSENDLWIAAIAKRFGLTVVSTDDDFQRIQEADSLDLETWLPSEGGSAAA